MPVSRAPRPPCVMLYAQIGVSRALSTEEQDVLVRLSRHRLL